MIKNSKEQAARTILISIGIYKFQSTNRREKSYKEMWWIFFRVKRSQSQCPALLFGSTKSDGYINDVRVFSLHFLVVISVVRWVWVCLVRPFDDRRLLESIGIVETEYSFSNAGILFYGSGFMHTRKVNTTHGYIFFYSSAVTTKQ